MIRQSQPLTPDLRIARARLLSVAARVHRQGENINYQDPLCDQLREAQRVFDAALKRERVKA